MLVSIRYASQDDLDALLTLLPQLPPRTDSSAARMPQRDEAERILEQLLRTECAHLLIADDDQAGVLVGTATLVVVPNLTHSGRPWGIVESVVVSKSSRGGGIGRLLMNKAIEIARSKGCYKVQLLSGPRPKQINFYKKLHFDSECCVGHKLYLDP